MKKSLFACLLLLLFIGCSQEKQPLTENTGRVQLLATTAMIADLVQEIGGEEVEVCVLIPPQLDPHSYELVKGDDDKFTSAQLIFYNGLGLEHGISLRRQLARYKEKAVCVTSTLLQEEPSSLLTVEGLYDPHVWMDVSLWSKTLDPITEALSLLLPESAEQFFARKEVLLQKMEAADKVIYAKLQSIPSEKRYLVTSHDAFHYFTRRYMREGSETDWQKRCNAPEGLAPEAELSTVDLQNVLAFMQEHNTKVLFTESNLNSRAVGKLLDAGSKKGLTLHIAEKALYADSMGLARSYLEMINHNAEVIAMELCR